MKNLVAVDKKVVVNAKTGLAHKVVLMNKCYRGDPIEGHRLGYYGFGYYMSCGTHLYSGQTVNQNSSGVPVYRFCKRCD